MGLALEAKESFLDAVFPKRCVACEKWGAFICEECEADLPTIGSPRCHRCGNPGPKACLCITDATRIWPLEGMRSAFDFEKPVREAILALKYSNLRAVGETLAGYLGEMLEGDGLAFDMIVPVPLHRRRMRQRGYNQSEVLARNLGKRIETEVETRRLRRVTYVGPQARASSAEERRANVARAFRWDGESLTGAKVAIIDDVTTTGATLRACANVLKRAGATEVWGVTVAREL